MKIPMKTTKTLVVLLGGAGCMPSILGEGGVRDEVRDLSGFVEVVSEDINVQARIGETWQVTVRTDDNLLTHVKTTVSGDRLSLSLEAGAEYFPTLLEVEVVAPSLAFLSQEGTADLRVEGLAADALHVSASGTGHTELLGEVGALLLESSGGGVRNAQALLVEEAEVLSASSGPVWVTVTDTLTGTLSGPGDLNVFGDPKRRDVVVTGSGTVVYY